LDTGSLLKLIDLLPDGVLLSNQEGKIVHCNQAAGQLFGYDSGELQDCEIKDLVPRPPQVNYQQHFEKYHSDSASLGLSERTGLKGIRKDQSTFALDIRLNPLELEGEDVVFAVLRDLTEKQEKAQLEQKNKDLERFSYIVSHDLQEPLRTIQSFSQVLLQKEKDRLDQQSLKSLEYISKSVGRMTELVNSLSDYGRLNKKQNWEEVDLNLVLEEVLQDLADKMERADAFALLGTLPTIVGSKTEMRLYFQNLISNAIKFQPKDNQALITIFSKETSEHYIVAVQDNGIGIDPKDHRKVFQVFERLHSKREYEGSGIGLANCARIAENHNAEIWVESTLGEGSIFYLQLDKTTS
jgi:PAS domain S-box-containing protein